MRFIYWIISLFKKSEPIESKPVEQTPLNPPDEVKMPTPKENDFDEWVMKAAEIIATFEGNGVDWSNPVGNFDGAYLTCGLMGFTWKYNNQPPMIKEFIKRHGADALIRLMPKCGSEYIRAANLGESGGSYIVKKWSSGYKVLEPYKSELAAFWGSPGMIEIQKEKIMEMMGTWGTKKMLETQAYFKMSEPKFQHLVYWMDQATLNGTGKTPSFADGEKVSINTVIDFCATAGGYNQSDLRKNGTLWNKMIDSSPADEKLLWKMAYLRAKASKSEFMGTVINRRGTLALGKGYVNGSLRTYDWF
jgi:hypothetical protein